MFGGRARLVTQLSWMAFVNGENLTIRAQNLAGQQNLNMMEGKHYKKDTFIWLPGYRGTDRVQQTWCATEIQQTAIRSSYYASVVGDVQTVEDTEQKLWELGFSPNVYKKARKDQKAKGIDVALTKDMLTHAFLGNYQAAILFAGDGDYVPLVEEVKRFGKRVHVAFLTVMA